MNKISRVCLKILSDLGVHVKKTYKTQRKVEGFISKLYKKPSSYKIWDHAVKNGLYEIPVRIFEPPAVPSADTMIFFHGGGWVTGNIDTYDHVCVNMASQTGQRVVSVDYRLAPEYKFPAAVEDCYAVVREVFRGYLAGADISGITLIGDSAGGNLAAAVSLMARDRGEFNIERQILIYPATNNDHSEYSPFRSVIENGSGYLLTSKRVKNFMDLYMHSKKDLQNPYFAPLCARDFGRQPRTLIITAELCPLRDEGEFYAKQLKAAGGDVTVYCMEKAMHGFFSLPAIHPQVKTAYKKINEFIKRGELR